MDPLILSVLMLVLCFLGLSWFAGSDAPFVATSMEQMTKILKLARVKKGKRFYELGSGDGRVVLEAAKLGAISYGVEQSWLRVWYSRYLARKSNLPQVYFYHGNLFTRNYYPADVVYLYLLSPAVDKLEIKLTKELKKRAIVITQQYHFKNWKP